MISPQSPGLEEKEEGSKRNNVGVTGMAPVRLLPETSRVLSEDWFNGGTVPLKRFQLNRRK